MFYGDVRILKDHYEGMKKYVNYLINSALGKIVYHKILKLYKEIKKMDLLSRRLPNNCI